MFAEINKEHTDLLPFILRHVGETSRQNPVLRPEGNSFHEFIWIKRGDGLFHLGDEHITLHEGEGAFIRRGIPHSYRGDDFHTIWITFNGAEGLLDFCETSDYFTFQAPTWLNEATAELMRELSRGGSIVSRSGKGYSLVAELLDVIFSERASSMHRVRQYLENRYAEPLSLEEIAAAIGVDRYALCHRYQREYGCSVMADLCRIRIAKAKQFLRYSGDPIEQVGRLCGFQSPSYFTKRFHEVAGCTPKAYRERHNH